MCGFPGSPASLSRAEAPAGVVRLAGSRDREAGVGRQQSAHGVDLVAHLGFDRSARIELPARREREDRLPPRGGPDARARLRVRTLPF